MVVGAAVGTAWGSSTPLLQDRTGSKAAGEDGRRLGWLLGWGAAGEDTRQVEALDSIPSEQGGVKRRKRLRIDMQGNI